MAKSIESSQGIGRVYGRKLRKIGCSSPAALLRDGRTRRGRKEIAKNAGISVKIVLRCVNMADLFRVKGVAGQFAELLEASGVDTIKELRKRRADVLAAKMQQVNARKRLTRVVPSERVVALWISQAKRLKPIVTY